MPTVVKCSVSNCTFWEENNLCGADSIQVEIDKHATNDFDTEFATIGGEEHRDRASTSAKTCCQTFTPKS